MERKIRQAAVLLLLYKTQGGYHILFTKRTQKVEHHKGQISFPGGEVHPQDETMEATALRECFEEIGVKPEDVTILGELDNIKTFSSNYIITPFVATIPYPYEFKVNADEVEELFRVPVKALLAKDKFRQSFWVYEGKTYPAYFYEYGGLIIWGATARVLKQFLDLFFPGE